METYGVIYLLIDGTNDMEYVGQTTRTIKRRFWEHTRRDYYLDRAIRAHGADMFVICILKVCYSKEELDYWERYFIKARDTKSPNGYNLTEGGDGTVGYTYTDEHRANLSATMKGKPHSPEQVRKFAMSHRKYTPYKNLLREIERRHLTYKALSKVLSLNGSAITAKMRGKVNFTAEQIVKLVKFFDLPAEYLFARDDGKNAIPKSYPTPFKNLIYEIYKKGLSYNVLAGLLNVSCTSVSAKMRGKQNFTAEQIAKLVEIFGKAAEYLLARDDEKSIISGRYQTPFKNLLTEIDKHHLTYTSFGELLGLSQSTISYKMCGKSKFTEEQIAKLVEIFGKPAEYLMQRDED